jgi:hypothetical protein
VRVCLPVAPPPNYHAPVQMTGNCWLHAGTGNCNATRRCVGPQCNTQSVQRVDRQSRTRTFVASTQMLLHLTSCEYCLPTLAGCGHTLTSRWYIHMIKLCLVSRNRVRVMCFARGQRSQARHCACHTCHAPATLMASGGAKFLLLLPFIAGAAASALVGMHICNPAEN